jgi:hypothetical protein
MEWLELDPTPANEECQQVGPKYDRQMACFEARLFVRQLQEQFPNHCDIEYRIKTHISGDYSYYEIRIIYDTDCEVSIEQAFDVESNAWTNWTDKSRDILNRCIASLVK